MSSESFDDIGGVVLDWINEHATHFLKYSPGVGQEAPTNSTGRTSLSIGVVGLPGDRISQIVIAPVTDGEVSSLAVKRFDGTHLDVAEAREEWLRSLP